MTPKFNGRVWLLDVDGTLTPPRGRIDFEFSQWLARFAEQRDVRIVTGGDRERIIKQLGRLVVERLTVSYNCLGNSVWMQGMEVDRLSFEPPAEFSAFAQAWFSAERLPEGCMPRVVFQAGLMAVTLLPSDAGDALRSQVETWDAQTRVRARFSQAVSLRFPELDAQVAGTTSVDVFPRGRDKSQVCDRIEQPVMFFADKTAPGGNDHTLATALVERGDSSVVHTVRNWRQTWAWLKRYVKAEQEHELARYRTGPHSSSEHILL